MLQFFEGSQNLNSKFLSKFSFSKKIRKSYSFSETEMTQSITIGILALQGAFLEHQSVLQKLKIPCKLVKTAKDLEGIDGLIIPGGESTSMGIIAEANGILPFLKKFLQEKPIWVCLKIVFFHYLNFF